MPSAKRYALSGKILRAKAKTKPKLRNPPRRRKRYSQTPAKGVNYHHPQYQNNQAGTNLTQKDEGTKKG